MRAKLFACVFSMSVLSNIAFSANPIDTKPTPPKIATTKINLNTASVAELTNSFKGIGERRAKNIVSYRTEHGKYKDISDLAKVKGLGATFVNKNIAQLQAKFTTSTP